MTLAGDMIAPSSIVTFTLEVTTWTIGAGWAWVGTNRSLKIQKFRQKVLSILVNGKKRKDERWECHGASLTLLTPEVGGKQSEETTKHGQ